MLFIDSQADSRHFKNLGPAQLSLVRVLSQAALKAPIAELRRLECSQVQGVPPMMGGYIYISLSQCIHVYAMYFVYVLQCIITQCIYALYLSIYTYIYV